MQAFDMRYQSHFLVFVFLLVIVRRLHVKSYTFSCGWWQQGTVFIAVVHGRRVRQRLSKKAHDGDTQIGLLLFLGRVVVVVALLWWRLIVMVVVVVVVGVLRFFRHGASSFSGEFGVVNGNKMGSLMLSPRSCSATHQRGSFYSLYMLRHG